jgi:nucleotide-binding universal stress UspA family protein
MFKHIVAAFDGSENAEKAIPWVKRLAGREKALVVLVRAVSWPVPLDAEHVEAGVQEAREYLQRIEREFNFAGVPTKIVARVGAAPAVVIDVAAEHRADLVVMTTRGGSKVTRWLVGGTAEQVMRTCEVPVFLVRSQTPVPKQAHVSRILVPVDGSRIADEIVPWAADLAQHLKASLLFVHVTPPGMKGRSAAYERIFERLTRRMNYLGGELKKRGVSASFRIETGDPAEKILKVAARCQLVATTTHGYGGVKRWIFGSVAEKVVHGAPVPVIIYRGHGPGWSYKPRQGAKKTQPALAGAPLWK